MFLFRTMTRRNGKFALGAVLLWCQWGCHREAPQPAPSDTIEIIAANPIVKQIVEWDDYTARLEPIEFVMIRGADACAEKSDSISSYA